MIRETIKIIRMYFLMLQYYKLNAKTQKHALKMAKYINTHKEKLKTQEGRKILGEMYKICERQQKMNETGSRH